MYTSIEIEIYEKRLFRADKRLGNIRFGTEATESSEIIQWQDVIDFPESSVSTNHVLMR